MAYNEDHIPDYAAEEMQLERVLYPIPEGREVGSEENRNDPDEQDFIDNVLYEATTMRDFLEDMTTEYGQAASAFFFRTLFSSERLIINDPSSYTDLIERLLRLVTANNVVDETKSNAAWAVREFTCKSNQIHMMTGMSTIEILSTAINVSSIRTPCLSCLSLIAAHCEECKTRCWRSQLFFNVVASLKYKYVRLRDYEDVRAVVGCLRHLLDSGAAERIEIRTIVLRKVLKFFTKVLRKYLVWSDVAEDSMFAIVFMTNGLNHIKLDVLVKEHKLMDFIFESIMSDKLLYSSIKVVSNLIRGSDAHRNATIAHRNFQEALLHCLRGQAENVKDIAVNICHLIASSGDSMDVLFVSEDVFKLLVEYSGNTIGERQKTCAWTIVRMLNKANEERITSMMSADLCNIVPTLLALDDDDLFISLLKAMCNVLPRCPTQAALLRETDFLSVIESRIFRTSPHSQPFHPL